MDAQVLDLCRLADAGPSIFEVLARLVTATPGKHERCRAVEAGEQLPSGGAQRHAVLAPLFGRRRWLGPGARFQGKLVPGRTQNFPPPRPPPPPPPQHTRPP